MPSEAKFDQIQRAQNLVLCRFTHLGSDAWEVPGAVWKLKSDAVVIKTPTGISCNYYDPTGTISVCLQFSRLQNPHIARRIYQSGMETQ